MAHPNEDLLRSLYDAFARGDIDAIAGRLSNDVVFHQPGRNPTSGDYEGIPAVLGLLGMLVERSGGTFRAEVHDVLGGDEHTIGLLRVSGTREGKSVDAPVVHVLHVEDGKVAEWWAVPTDQHALDDFWA